VSVLRYELGFHIPEDDILHSHCRENLKSYKGTLLFALLLVATFQQKTTSQKERIQDLSPTLLP
jgi:hypothetical protein